MAKSAGKFAPADELPVPQVLGRRVIFEIAARHARQPFTAQLTDRSTKCGCR
jgi:hypothetical protein